LDTIQGLFDECYGTLGKIEIDAHESSGEADIGMMMRQDMLKSGKGPADILAFGENVKKFLSSGTPTGPSEKYLSEAADNFFARLLRM
jgi:hypothetical protein